MGHKLSKPAFIIAIVMASIVCDQLGKAVARQMLQPGVVKVYLHDSVRLQITENTGALLSLGESLPETTRFWLFTVIVFLVLASILIYAQTVDSRNRNKAAGLSLIAGGGFSNLIDRLINDGAVTDYVSIGIGNLRTGIFNLADFLILTGVVVILLFHRNEGMQ